VSALFKEALAALRDIRDNMTAKDGHVFRRLIDGLGLAESALEAAQQEAEAWEAIEAWQKAGGQTRSPRLRSKSSGGYVVDLVHAVDVQRFDGSTRTEALTKAEEWCRSELERATRCRQCGDSQAKCNESMCCVGCNHGVRSAREFAK
jgi:hypothetical protein